jgi:hypothetical protein
LKRAFLKFAGSAAVVALLSACAASGVKYEQAAASMPSLKPDHGRIYFLRSASMMGAAVQPDIKLNGTVVGTSKPGGYFYVDQPAGRYDASASTETEKHLTFALQSGEIKYVRSYVTFGVVVGRVALELYPPDTAKAELQSLSYTGK